MTKKYDKLCTVGALDTNFLIFVETKLDGSEAGVYYIEIDDSIYDNPDECKDFDDKIQKYKKQIYSLARDENVLLIKAKGNAKALIVASTVKTSTGTKATLDVMTTTNQFKRCKEQTYDGEITGLDVTIFSPEKEAACMIYSLKKSTEPGEDCVMCFHG